MLSGGEQQRLAVAVSLANGPRLLPADEPTSQLDGTNRDRVLDLLRAANRNFGTTLVVVTHDPAVAAALDRWAELWWSRYGMCEEFHAEHGHLRVRTDHWVDDFALGSWIISMRQRYKNDLLSEEQVTALECIGMLWDGNPGKSRLVPVQHTEGIVQVERWGRMYELARQYYAECGHLAIPLRYRAEGLQLGRWLSEQRYAAQEEDYSQQRHELLDAVEMARGTDDALGTDGGWTGWFGLAGTLPSTDT